MTDTALDDLMALLRIPGPPGDERAVAAHLRGVLTGLGVPADCIGTDEAQKQSEYGGNTGNLIVRLDGHGRGARRMFSTHMDTVPGCVGAEPRVDGDRIVNDAEGKALGGDNRAGCTVLLQVARTLTALRGDHAPTTLVFFIQEEVGLVGARGLDLTKLGTPRPTLGFNFDGHEAEEFVTAVIGTERHTIEVEGIAAHSGCNPGDGISAGIIAALALAELEKEGWHGVVHKPEGRGTANLGIIKGGTGSNVVMPILNILAEARSHDPAFRKQIIDKWRHEFIEAAIRQTNGRDNGKVRFGPGPTYEAFALADDAPVVKMVLAASEKCGLNGRCVSNDGGMDANWIVAHGIPALTIGVGQRNVHMPTEELDLHEFRKACKIATTLATMS